MRSIQAEHAEWVAKKYPNQPPEVPAAGCVEEAGELLHAILKLEQVRIWGEDERYKIAELRVELVDAVGDCAIYACSLCNANGWAFELDYVPMDSPAISTLQMAAKLVEAAVGVAVNPRELVKLTEYLDALHAIANSIGIDVEAATEVTWSEVRCR